MFLSKHVTATLFLVVMLFMKTGRSLNLIREKSFASNVKKFIQFVHKLVQNEKLMSVQRFNYQKNKTVQL